MFTHYVSFTEESQKVPVKIRKGSLDEFAVKRGLVRPTTLVSMPGIHEIDGSNTEKIWKMVEANPQIDDEDDEPEDPQLHILVAVATFFISAVLLFLCTDYVVNSINELIEHSGLSSTFVGLILLPIPNCDHTPVTAAMRDVMDSTLQLTVIKSIQTALLVLPFTVLLGWALGVDEATLVFDGFEVVSLFATIILLNLIIGKGETIW